MADIFAEAEKFGNRNRVLYFASTSKVTLPGSGIAMVAASEDNIKEIKAHMGIQTIGYDKINQLRHVAYFKNADNVRNHMIEFGKLIKEKFDITLSYFDKLSGEEIAEWSVPKGGYFISLDITVGSATEVYNKMKAAGVTLTQVGSTYPYGKDPEDKNLRIAPTYPTNADLEKACAILVSAIRLTALEKILNK